MAWGDEWPDWTDAGRSVEITLKGGSTVVGVLTYEDFATDGADEYPLWKVRLIDGTAVDFVDHERWRFVAQDKPDAV